MRVALYARVSTERQEQQGTIASQLDALTRWAREQHHDVVDAYVCVDDGYSGTRLDRPGLDRLRDGAEAGAFKAALVLCPDRLARKYAYQILILEELERFDVRVIFLDQPLSDDPQARLLTQIQGAVAEYERIKIAERYRRGKLFRARQGEVCWGKVPYGYRRIPRRDGVPAHVEVSEPEAQVVRQIFRWHVDEHLSVRQIALRLTESPHVTATGLPRWGISTVTRMLHNEAYIGTMYYNRRESVGGKSNSASRRQRLSTCRQDRPAAEWIPLPVPPIIDAELFRRSQAIHYDNSRFSPRHLKSGHYLLRRVVRCRVCDLAMSCHRMRGRNGTFHHYYYCAGHDVLYARRAVGRCPQRNLRADELDKLVWGQVRRHLEHPALIREGHTRLQAQSTSLDGDGLADEVHALEKQLAELDREEHRLLDAYQAALIDLDQLRQRQVRLRQRRAHVNGSIEVLRTERTTAQQQAQLQADLETFVDRIRGPLATLDFDARQQLVRTVLERVMVEDGRVDIHFAIPLPDPPPDTTNPSVSAHFHLRSNGSQHVTVVQQPVEYRRGDHHVTEHLAPFADRTVRRDQDAAALVAPRDELEEQVRGVRLEGQVAQLVDDEKLRLGVEGQAVLQAVGAVRLDQRRHQRLGRGEQRRVALPDRLAPECDRQVRFPDSWRTEQEGRVPVRDPPRRRQFPDLTLVDARLRLEVEVRQLADCREVGDLERHLDAPFVLARHLALDEERERLAQRQLLLRGLVEQAVELVPDGGQLQPRQPAEERLMVHDIHLRSSRRRRPHTRRAGAAAPASAGPSRPKPGADRG